MTTHDVTNNQSSATALQLTMADGPWCFCYVDNKNSTADRFVKLPFPNDGSLYVGYKIKLTWLSVWSSQCHLRVYAEDQIHGANEVGRRRQKIIRSHYAPQEYGAHMERGCCSYFTFVGALGQNTDSNLPYPGGNGYTQHSETNYQDGGVLIHHDLWIEEFEHT